MQEPKIKFSHVTKQFETRSQTILAVKDYSMEIQPASSSPFWVRPAAANPP